MNMKVHIFHAAQITGFNLPGAVKYFSDITRKTEGELLGILGAQSKKDGAIEQYKSGGMTSEKFCQVMAPLLGMVEEEFKKEWVNLINLFFTEELLDRFEKFYSKLENDGDGLYIISSTNALQHDEVSRLLRKRGIDIAPEKWFLSHEQKISADLNKEYFQKQGMEALTAFYGVNVEIVNHLDNKDPDLILNLGKSRLRYG